MNSWKKCQKSELFVQTKYIQQIKRENNIIIMANFLSRSNPVTSRGMVERERKRG